MLSRDEVRAMRERAEALPEDAGAFVDWAYNHLGPISCNHHQAIAIAQHIQSAQNEMSALCSAYLSLLDRVEAIERTGRVFVKEAAADPFHSERYAIAMDEFNAELEPMA